MSVSGSRPPNVRLESWSKRRRDAASEPRACARIDACRPAAGPRQQRTFHLKTLITSRGFRAALAAIALAGSVSFARADVKDYEFRLLDSTVAVGRDKIVAVQLINKTTGKPVPDAVIFAVRLDMAPDGMPEMATKIVPEPGGDAGTYRFKAAFGMEGRWQLSLGAKVQGETGTVESKFVITAQK